MGRPVWWFDEDAADIRQLCDWALNQFDRQSESSRVRPLRRTLSPKNCPALYDHLNADRRMFIWDCMRALSPALLTTVGQERLSESPPELDCAVCFAEGAEACLRLWLDRPTISKVLRDWQRALQDYKDLIDAGCVTQELPWPELVYSPHVILAGLRRLRDLSPDARVTWRQLSAKCFAGDSKYLDRSNRQRWLLSRFPQLDRCVIPRPLLCAAHLTVQADKVLIVENQDSFLHLQPLAPQLRAHLVYSHGFTGAAERVRERGYVHFSFSGDLGQSRAFEAMWFTESPESIPIAFWGDLDYAGLAILAVLRQRFPGLEAWRPGYAPMLAELSAGGGHKPALAGKDRQMIGGSTGCQYTDMALLPALGTYGRFVDQEIVTNELIDLALVSEVDNDDT